MKKRFLFCCLVRRFSCGTAFSGCGKTKRPITLGEAVGERAGCDVQGFAGE